MKGTKVTEEYLRQKYHVEGMSLRQIASECGLSSGTLRYHMKRWGVPRRTKSEALSGTKNPMHGKPKSEEARRKTSETLRQTNLDPVVRARRSASSSGPRNGMYGKTHTEEVRAILRAGLVARCRDPEFIAAHSAAMAKPNVRQALSDNAKRRTGSGNPFFGKEHSAETKAKLTEANKGRFQGPNGSNWQGGKTRLATLIRNSEPAIRWRKAVFERDAFTCQVCRKVGGALHADHVRPLALLLDEHGVKTLEEAYNCPALWDLSNGRTLCVPCHKATPSFAGKYQKNYKRKPVAV